MGSGMGYRAVASCNLNQAKVLMRLIAHKGAFDTAMLVPAFYFEMQYLFAVALKAKVPGLDDTCMNRANRNLMNLFATHFKITGHSGYNL